MSDAIVVLVTTATEEEGARIARALVAEQLVACVNIVRGIRSIYAWQGEVADDVEHLLILKTRRASFPAVERRVRELHSYDVPEVIALDVVEGSAPYLQWLRSATGSD